MNILSILKEEQKEYKTLLLELVSGGVAQDNSGASVIENPAKTPAQMSVAKPTSAPRQTPKIPFKVLPVGDLQKTIKLLKLQELMRQAQALQQMQAQQQAGAQPQMEAFNIKSSISGIQNALMSGVLAQTPPSNPPPYDPPPAPTKRPAPPRRKPPKPDEKKADKPADQPADKPVDQPTPPPLEPPAEKDQIPGAEKKNDEPDWYEAEHEVVDGDNLYLIAAKHMINIGALPKDQGLTKKDLIRIKAQLDPIVKSIRENNPSVRDPSKDGILKLGTKLKIRINRKDQKPGGTAPPKPAQGEGTAPAGNPAKGEGTEGTAPTKPANPPPTTPAKGEGTAPDNKPAKGEGTETPKQGLFRNDKLEDFLSALKSKETQTGTIDRTDTTNPISNYYKDDFIRTAVFRNPGQKVSTAYGPLQLGSEAVKEIEKQGLDKWLDETEDDGNGNQRKIIDPSLNIKDYIDKYKKQFNKFFHGETGGIESMHQAQKPWVNTPESNLDKTKPENFENPSKDYNPGKGLRHYPNFKKMATLIPDMNSGFQLKDPRVGYGNGQYGDLSDRQHFDKYITLAQLAIRAKLKSVGKAYGIENADTGKDWDTNQQWNNPTFRNNLSRAWRGDIHDTIEPTYGRAVERQYGAFRTLRQNQTKPTTPPAGGTPAGGTPAGTPAGGAGTPPTGSQSRRDTRKKPTTIASLSGKQDKGASTSNKPSMGSRAMATA
jgi:hypothetical protein